MAKKMRISETENSEPKMDQKFSLLNLRIFLGKSLKSMDLGFQEIQANKLAPNSATFGLTNNITDNWVSSESTNFV